MFPVAIWVPHAYPRESPIIYVTPTQDMAVRPGQYVSGEGRVYHPCLANWRDDVSLYCLRREVDKMNAYAMRPEIEHY